MPRKKSSRQKFFRTFGFWISIVLSFCVGGFYVLSHPEIRLLNPNGILEIIEAKSFDLRLRLRGTVKPSDKIVIIAINEKTEDELGRWQSAGRRWLAQTVDLLHQGGAKIIAFDFTLAEADKGTVPEAFETLKARYAQIPGKTGTLPPELLDSFEAVEKLYDYDLLLTEAIQRAGNVVLGMYFFFDKSSAEHIDDVRHAAFHQTIERVKYSTIRYSAGTQRPPLNLLHAFGVEPNVSAFSKAAGSFGHFSMIPHHDGYVRQIPLLIEYMGEYYPSLDLEVSRAWFQSGLPPIIYALPEERSGSVEGIQLGETFIPTDRQAKLLINYYGPAQTFPHYSISDLLRGRVPPERFRDKIALVGFTGSIYQDVHSVSFQAETYPGVEVHATIIENILRRDFITRPGWTLIVELLLILSLGVILGIILQRAHPFAAVMTVLFSLAFVMILAHSAFLYQKIWLNLSFPVLLILLDYLLITTYKYVLGERKGRKIKNAFQHYVAPTVVDQMLETIDSLKLGGERRIMSVLFADIRDFTGISEKMGPEALVQFLNEFFTMMTRTVLDYEGTVDKYMGDNIMAFFGAPIEQPNHAVRVCKTALDMLSHLQTLQGNWRTDGVPPIAIGVGINSGEMSVGNMGSEELFDYTIMGDS
ncbi:MAG: adenylate/guanylate cyclase domain-containing protein, partial [bacterium]|nr:adenylate/guanylate cyclase domain-containing protein [bacterium]